MHSKRSLVLIAALSLALGSLGVSAIAQELTEPPPEGDTGLTKVSKPQGEAAPKGPAAASDQPAGTEGEAQPGPRGPKDFFGQNSFFFVLIGGFILLYIWMGRSRRKKEAKRREMLSNLKKGDKVTSIGGVVGTVMEVREDEVSVKVDENNNIRMKFARWAIRGVGEDAKTEGPEQQR